MDLNCELQSQAQGENKAKQQVVEGTQEAASSSEYEKITPYVGQLNELITEFETAYRDYSQEIDDKMSEFRQKLFQEFETLLNAPRIQFEELKTIIDQQNQVREKMAHSTALAQGIFNCLKENKSIFRDLSQSG